MAIKTNLKIYIGQDMTDFIKIIAVSQKDASDFTGNNFKRYQFDIFYSNQKLLDLIKIKEKGNLKITQRASIMLENEILQAKKGGCL